MTIRLRELQGQLPGSFSGQLPGQLPGSFPGQLPGQLPGSFPGQLPGQLLGQPTGSPHISDHFSMVVIEQQLGGGPHYVHRHRDTDKC